MKCINCNVELPDGAELCPMCGAKATKDIMRCPKCFVKLEKDSKVCSKCGIDIERFLAEEAQAPEPKEKISTKKLVITAGAVVLAVAITATGFGLWRSHRAANFKKAASDYAESLEDSIKIINTLADEYNKIYDGQWLIQTENATALEKKYSGEIAELKDSRDTFTYLASDIAGKSVSDSDARLVKELFNDFEECYKYVVGKKGKYPGYMTGYKEVYAKYEKSLEKLRNRIEN